MRVQEDETPGRRKEGNAKKLAEGVLVEVEEVIECKTTDDENRGATWVVIGLRGGVTQHPGASRDSRELAAPGGRQVVELQRLYHASESFSQVACIDLL